jgi:hypothetical protein
MTVVDMSSGAASDTTSLSSGVTKFRYENGRRYHGYKDGLYMFVHQYPPIWQDIYVPQRQPNDEKQLNVQDLG